ncbi:hydrogenase maturation protease [Pseudalkalibacillus sp. R45]|uniref:hydrogenase maturation protease n=1 Tax=Pseudalkalibacillus sp. R45 TaxID=3457433 RepID=UPI003FCC8B44
MEKRVVLGLGNRLMMDDGIGIYLVEDLQRENLASSFQFFVGETDVEYCLQVIEECPFLIVIDAVGNDRKPGDISLFDLKDMHAMSLGYSAHNFHFFHMLEHMDVEGLLIGIEPYKIDFQDSLSEVLLQKYPLIKHKVIHELSLLKEKGTFKYTYEYKKK